MYTPCYVEELLSPEAMKLLSPGAQRLFTTIYNRMNFLGKNEIVTINKHISGRMKVRPNKLPALQIELAEAGFLDIGFDQRPGFVAGARSTVYRWIATDQEAA